MNDKNLEGKLYFKNTPIKELFDQDVFMLRYVEGGVKYVISEILKQEIEDAGCIGIEFQQVELSLNEWLAQKGRREKIYGKSKL